MAPLSGAAGLALTKLLAMHETHAHTSFSQFHAASNQPADSAADCGGQLRKLTVIHSGNVSASATAAKTQAARNLPSTASHGVTGSVSSSSTVPDFRSSAQSRIEIAGMRKR